MPGERENRTAGGEAKLTRTTGADDPHERVKSNPTAEELSDPKEVWKDGETTPSKVRASRSGSHRVADAGDIGGGQPTPYSTETQADALAKQSGKGKNRGRVEKPKQ